MLNGQNIFLNHFQEVYLFNVKREFRYFKSLTRKHVYLSAQGKMCNHLATDVLGRKMVSLFKHYKDHLQDNGSKFNATIELLEVTSSLVEFFSNTQLKISHVSEPPVGHLMENLTSFHDWENQFKCPKDQLKHLITKETRQDIDACIYGFINLLKVAQKLKISLIPGYINSDLIENWFCQHRGPRNGFNQNPTLCQIAGATNSNIITGSVTLSKGNTGGSGNVSKGVMPPTKKFKCQ